MFFTGKDNMVTLMCSWVRFQVVLGHYMFYAHHYDGQADPWYARMCMITDKLKLRLSPIWQDDHMLNEENELALEVYNQLAEKHGMPIYPKLGATTCTDS
jgi:hypothetical protein